MNDSATTALLEPSTTSDAISAPVNAGGLIDRVRHLFADSVIRKGMLSVFDQAVVSGTSFVTSVVIGRLCGKDDLGVYYLALSIVLLLRGIQEQLISAPYSVYCHRQDGEQLAQYTGSTFSHQFLLLIAAAVGLTGFAAIVSAGYGPSGFDTTAWILIGAVPFLLLRESIRHFAFGRLSLRSAIGVDVAVAAMQLAGLGLLFTTGSLSVGMIYVVMGIACAAACLGWWLFRSEQIAVKAARILPDWKRNWTFSKWALASHLVGCSSPYILPWFVAAVDGTAATGVLAACTTLVGLGNAFMMGLSNYLTPKAAKSFADGGVVELRHTLKKTAWLFAVTLGGFAMLSCFVGDVIAVLVYGESYAGAGPILAILAFGLFAGSMSVTAGNGLWAIDKPSANFRADVCALIATVIAAVTLTPAYGVWGAALSSLIGASVDAVIRMWTLLRLLAELTPTATTEECDV